MRALSALSTLFFLLASGPVSAAVFTVTMTSGSTFVTRYQPHQSDTEQGKILLLTEFGNWISLPEEAVASIAADTESKGFGTVLDSQTIALGWAPQSSGSQSQASGDASAPQDPTAQLLQFMIQQNNPAPAPAYSNQLVVEPSQSSGIPIGLISRP